MKKEKQDKPKEAQDEIIKLDDGTLYRTVAGRKVIFNKNFPNGSINVELVSNAENKEYFVFKCTVIPDLKAMSRQFTAYGSCERIPGNKFASMEKAETTAIGRALSHMSENIIGAQASDDEINKAIEHQEAQKPTVQQGARAVFKEEEKKVEPKGEPVYDTLSPKDKETAILWADKIKNSATKDSLTEIGVLIKDAKLNKAISEELRKEFNKQLRALSSKKE